jgi:hypothetical protein
MRIILLLTLIWPLLAYSLSKPTELRIIVPVYEDDTPPQEEVFALPKPRELRVASLVNMIPDKLTIVSHSVKSYVSQQKTTVSVTFNRYPDMFSMDQAWRTAHAFQVYYSKASIGNCNTDCDYIVRGPEYHIFNNIPIRRWQPSVHTLETWYGGGWGEIVYAATPVWEGYTVTIDIPWQYVDLAPGKGKYRVEVSYYGSWNQTASGNVQVY